MASLVVRSLAKFEISLVSTKFYLSVMEVRFVLLVMWDYSLLVDHKYIYFACSCFQEALNFIIGNVSNTTNVQRHCLFRENLNIFFPCQHVNISVLVYYPLNFREKIN